MSVISQGYPLWAVESDGRAYAVIGWEVREGVQYAMLADLGGHGGPGDAFSAEQVDGPVTFHTTDPSAGMISTGEAELRARMTRLADSFAGGGDQEFHTQSVATRIRDELAK